MDTDFSGLGVAMVTPFKADGTIDFESLERLVEHLVAGADYLVIMGTTGENPTISAREQSEILKRVKKVNAGRIPIVFGIGGNNTSEVVAKLEAFEAEGVQGILSVSPYYSKPNQEGMYKHFEELSNASPLPLILYNVPPRTGSSMTASTSLSLAELPGIKAIKEASGNAGLVMDILKSRKEGFQVLSGDDDLTLPYIALGMDGVISVVGNAFPMEFAEMIRLARANQFDEARKIHYRLLPIIKSIFMDGNPGGIKYLLSRMGICENYFRLPVHPVNQATMTAIDDAFAKW